MKIADVIEGALASLPQLPLHNREGAAAQMKAFIPLMERFGCRDAANALRRFVGIPTEPSATETRPIELVGILSPDIEGYRRLMRDEYKAAFEEAETLSTTAWGYFSAWRGDTTRASNAHAVVFLSKCVQACQATLLLGERGLELEAAAVLREAYEYLFVGAAILQAPSIVQRLIRESEREHGKQAAKLHKPDDGEPIVDEQYLERLRTLAEGEVKGSGLSVYAAAEAVNMTGIYDGVYRTLSRMGTHATATTLLHGSGRDGNVYGGPARKHLAQLLEWTSDCLKLALAHAKDVGKQKSKDNGR
ncbi:hypothetical protein G2912_01070 [Paraburkholderia aspalathi]|uniref:Uncharacterized protein n=1 Tax=Paraburkholderia nemoris TaxID=2793076 RepID=A0ABN7KTX8_9BURK|nr:MULTISPECIES: DUF5677 domain-containing protein [Paraburkholderia]MBK3808939.1 hypothetical protein [Paraburkholderia aspalathi]CAE6705985.1 hypothetical protein R69776_00868 [Paraburkholderia nemoris]